MKKATEIFFMAVGIILAILGVLCLVNPTGSIGSMTKIIGVVLLIIGVGTIVFVITVGQALLFTGGVLGSAVSDILFGILLIMFNGTVSRIFVILYALILIAIGIAALVATPIAKKVSDGKAWLAFLGVGVLFLVLGIVAIVNQSAGAIIFMIPVGLILILVGVVYMGVSVGIQKATDDTKYFKDVKD